MLTNFFDKKFWYIFFSLAALEAASFLVYENIFLSKIIFLLILVVAAYLTFKDRANAVYLLLAELILGGKGYLFTWPISQTRISLRLAMFALIFIIWLYQIIKENNYAWLKSRTVKYFLGFLFFIVLGVKIGFLSGTPASAIFFDVNGLLYFGLLGLFLTARLNWQMVFKVLLAATAVIAVKTWAFLILAAHKTTAIIYYLAYRWIRDTGVGEITPLADHLHRVFLYSHLYNLFACLLLFVYLLRDKNLSRRLKLCLAGLFCLNFSALYLSQSRSFWLASAFSLFLLVAAAIVYFKLNFKKIVIGLLIVLMAFITSDFFSRAAVGNFQQSILFYRLASDAGGQASSSSRRAQITPLLKGISEHPLIGSGWGRSLGYYSSDPGRLTRANPSGWTVTYSFELGYLDLALKIGLLGLGAYLFFLGSLLKKIWQRKENRIFLGLFFSLLALLIIHAFTPYLNHPLGIGLILLSVALGG